MASGYEFLIQLKDYASSGIKKIAESVGLADDKVEKLDGKMHKLDKTGGVLSGTFGKLKGFIAGAFALGAVTLFTNNVIGARSEYERFQAVLTNTFQSADVGNGALNLLTDFAEKTPFQLNELTDSFVKLVNRGFTPAETELTKLGDLAASQGKGFGQLSEAILDAETNEFERLKEFGIKASKAGDQVSFSFKGITKTVKNNATSIRNAILEYGGMTGVADSMESISKTLGGRISNLKDQWWSFMVAVGGQSSSVFANAIVFMSSALSFLTDHLEHISAYFGLLWQMAQPVISAFKQLVSEVFGFDSASSVLDTFINMMMMGLEVFSFFTTGLTVLIGWLTPFADIIGIVTTAWGLFNLVVSMSPLGWIVIGVVALISALGFLAKHVDFTGVTWKKVWDSAGLVFELWWKTIKFQFDTMVNGIMIGIDKIQLGWYKFKESVGLGNSNDNKAMIDNINASVEARKEAIKAGANELVSLGKTALNSVGIKVDAAGVKKDFQSIKDKFSGLGQSDKSSQAYKDFVSGKGTKNLNTNTGGTGSKGESSVVSGGSKKTNINITIGKLTEDVNIHVTSAEKGIDDLGKKVQEVLLRAVNSVNQIQNA